MNATVLGALSNLPLLARLLDGYNGHAVCGLGKTNVGQAGWNTLAHNVRCCSVFVVNAKQALLVVTEVPHAVVADTDALFLLRGSETNVIK